MLPRHLHDSVARIGTTPVVPTHQLVVSYREVCVNLSFTIFKILVMTKFSERVVNYAPTVREVVVSMRDDACQCAPSLGIGKV